MASQLDRDFKYVTEPFVLLFPYLLSGGEPFYVLSHRAVMSIKEEIKYRTSCSVGNPQTLLCGLS